MTAPYYHRKWECGLSRPAAGGPYRYFTFMWKCCGIKKRGSDFIVFHLPPGRHLTTFDRLRCARRWCEHINTLLDWHVPDPHPDKSTFLAMHRAALEITGARPALHIVSDDIGGGR